MLRAGLIRGEKRQVDLAGVRRTEILDRTLSALSKSLLRDLVVREIDADLLTGGLQEPGGQGLRLRRALGRPGTGGRAIPGGLRSSHRAQHHERFDRRLEFALRKSLPTPDARVEIDFRHEID